MADNNIFQAINVSDLHFDYRNPRLAEYGLTDKSSENDILDILWDVMDVMELVHSISAHGFFRHEPLIIAEENGKKIVIEGNRRLAAVKILLNPSDKRRNSLPSLSSDKLRDLQNLPVLPTSREESWRYLGFKHINGPSKWSAFAKAKYIAEIYNQFAVPLDEIAKQIGDTHKTVQRLFRGYMVLEQARREKIYDYNIERMNKRFAFSHLYTGLEYEGFMEFLALTPDTEYSSESPISKEKYPALKELFVWLYGSKKTKTVPAISSQNPDLIRLNNVLKNREALAALRAERPLSEAYELTKPADRHFEESLLAAKRDLVKAQSFLAEGYDNSDDLMNIAETIFTLSEDILFAMKRKKSGNKSRSHVLQESE